MNHLWLFFFDNSRLKFSLVFILLGLITFLVFFCWINMFLDLWYFSVVIKNSLLLFRDWIFWANWISFRIWSSWRRWVFKFLFPWSGLWWKILIFDHFLWLLDWISSSWLWAWRISSGWLWWWKYKRNGEEEERRKWWSIYRVWSRTCQFPLLN